MPSLTDILNSKRNISPASPTSSSSIPIMDEDMFSLDSVQDNAELLKYLRPVLILHYLENTWEWGGFHSSHNLNLITEYFGVNKLYNRSSIVIPPKLIGLFAEYITIKSNNRIAGVFWTLSHTFSMMHRFLDEDDITNLQSLIERKLKNVCA